ncbi:MAG: 30S ribosomal protein S15 [Chloroflexi bacterium]|nr:30S ribosomal protein S15 [Chloroflexota bacterium]
MDKTEKTKVIETHQRDKSDTGSPEVQVALLTARITELTEHLQTHKHDESTRLGLIKMVGQRRRLLAYMQRKNYAGYVELSDKLNIRRK